MSHKTGVTANEGEGLAELEVLNLCGECMLTLNMSDSMYGRDLWKMIWTKSSFSDHFPQIMTIVPSKPSLQLVVSHKTSSLALNESLKQ